MKISLDRFFFFYHAEEIKGLSLRMYGSILAMKKYFQSPQHQKCKKGRYEKELRQERMQVSVDLRELNTVLTYFSTEIALDSSHMVWMMFMGLHGFAHIYYF